MIKKNVFHLLLFAFIWLILYLAYLFTNKSDLEKNRRLQSLFSNHKQVVLGSAIKFFDCKAGQLPDANCTPGAIFSNSSTAQICVSGYSRSVRNVSIKTKKEIYAKYNLIYPAKYGELEIDHLIPLALGGNNDPSNLWPQTARPEPGFKEKDLVEIYLHEEVCAGHIPLSSAQERIAGNWLEIYKNLNSGKIADLKSRYKNWAN